MDRTRPHAIAPATAPACIAPPACWTKLGSRGHRITARANAERKRSGASWGDALVRRLAPKVELEDLGPLSMRIGGRLVSGHEIRKKVLALLAFLACQPGGAATPDQILEGLWPELLPDQGINSVHQTIYFLRRVIDPDYRAGRSADYLHFDDDIVTFDRDLVDCASWKCRRLLDHRPETQQQVEQVLEHMRAVRQRLQLRGLGSPYRDTLHAAVLGADGASHGWPDRVGGREVEAMGRTADTGHRPRC